jgi:hypothetical protein
VLYPCRAERISPHGSHLILSSSHECVFGVLSDRKAPFSGPRGRGKSSGLEQTIPYQAGAQEDRNLMDILALLDNASCSQKRSGPLHYEESFLMSASTGNVCCGCVSYRHRCNSETALIYGHLVRAAILHKRSREMDNPRSR